MSLELPELPFRCDALEPHLSAETVRQHHGAHEAVCVENVNAIINGTELEFRPLTDILQLASGKLLAYATEAWNHAFYWNCLSPSGSNGPSGPLTAVIDQQFGSVDRCRKQFLDAAISLFGCGWVWLMKDINGELEVLPESNAGTLPREALTPILACDVWEHAYLLDYGNSRREYVEAFWNMINWGFVTEQYQRDRTPQLL